MVSGAVMSARYRSRNEMHPWLSQPTLEHLIFKLLIILDRNKNFSPVKSGFLVHQCIQHEVKRVAPFGYDQLYHYQCSVIQLHMLSGVQQAVDPDQYLELIDSGLAWSFCVKCKIYITWSVVLGGFGMNININSVTEKTRVTHFLSHGCYMRTPWIFMIPMREFMCFLCSSMRLDFQSLTEYAFWWKQDFARTFFSWGVMLGWISRRRIFICRGLT